MEIQHSGILFCYALIPGDQLAKMPMAPGCVQVPHIDFSLKLIKGLDLMALPGLQDGIRFGLKVSRGPGGVQAVRQGQGDGPGTMVAAWRRHTQAVCVWCYWIVGAAVGRSIAAMGYWCWPDASIASPCAVHIHDTAVATALTT